jgi:hypothetical protein
MNLLSSRSRASKINTLGAGTHVVTITNMVETDDCHRTFDGDAIGKENWDDACPQIAIVFANKDGVFTHRFNCKGFVRFSELSAKEQKLHTAGGDEGYAVNIKSHERVEDNERTDKCFNFLDDMAARTGLPEGSEYRQMTGRQVTIVIDTNANGNLRVTKTKKVAAAEPVLD